MPLARRLDLIDAWLLSLSWPIRTIVLLLTFVSLTAATLPRIPKAAVDFSHWPLLNRMIQPDHFGTDTLADMYETRVVRHDVWDMYTKRGVEQTPLEAATWSREASSPYPPVALLSLAVVASAGDAVGIGLYGAVAILALVFIGASFVYFLRTRWYVFAMLYLNGGYIAERFFFVQDGSYLLMLVVVIGALLLARRWPAVAHVLMAGAIAIKLSPVFHLARLRSMRPAVAAAVLGIVAAGLVLPALLWDHYLDIYRYQETLKGGGRWATAGGLAVAGVCGWLLVRADRRGALDLEDWIGWSLVPAALFFAVKLNAIRHLLIVLLIPDRRAMRNVAAAAGLAVFALGGPELPLNASLPIVTAVLLVTLYWLGRKTV
ncbi:MAG TPA: hypothetical protein VFV78_13340 [Vicinamibacterales bacterium]|nr:hypothetical protein [Vicinamibacterales bacterium]